MAYMPVPVPLHYQASLVRPLSSRSVDATAAAESPEHMLLKSIGMGLLTTFEAFAARDRIEVTHWEARVGGVVDGLELAQVHVEIDMEVSDTERARATLDEATQQCLITNALRAPVVIDAKFRRPRERKVG